MATIRLTETKTQSLDREPQYISDSIEDEVFGANFLFHRDGGQVPGTISETYQKFASEVNLTTLRYPGGGVAELYLDLKDPNSFLQADTVDGPAKEPTVPLSEFLDYAAAIKASPTIVVPSFRFLSTETDKIGHKYVDLSLDDDVRQFILTCLSEADRAGTAISAFELGNEWWVENRMTPIEYGRVANYLAKVIQEEVTKYEKINPAAFEHEPSIVVQVGPGGGAEWYSPSGWPVSEDYEGPVISATELIFRQFVDPQAKTAVDGILTHRYLHGSDADINGYAYSPFDTWQMLASQTEGFNKDPDRFVTEWNVSARNQNELGLQQFDTMVELVEEMLLAGVDHANVWAVQQGNETRLINNNGNGNENYGGLSFAGVAFDMMSAQLRGMRVIDGPSQIAGLALNSFGSDDKLVYFLTNREDTGRSDLISVADLGVIGHHATIYQITEGADGLPTVSVLTIDLGTMAGSLTLNFSPYESMMIVVSRRAGGSVIEGYDLADQLIGSAYADSIDGGASPDTIDGGAGNDSVVGGMGDDSIWGGTGNDTLQGGIGRDFLNGGIGNDVASYAEATEDLIIDMIAMEISSPRVRDDYFDGIEGFISGFGDDRIIGDSGNNFLQSRDGNDTSYGGLGDDTLIGGSGRDQLSGGDGNDIIYGGDGYDTRIRHIVDDAISDSGNNLNGGDGNDLLRGMGGVDQLNGGAGDDSMYGADGDDFVFGGDGNDFAWGGSGSDVLDGGSSNDILFGELGDDSIRGGGGDDVLLGGRGADFLFGGVGSDILFGGRGDDNLVGEDGDDRMEGSWGTDTLSGGDGSDTLFGGQGDDILYGDDGDDLLIGGYADDRLYGSEGNDFLYGGVGDDALYGEADHDRLEGDDGNDRLFGGEGSDLALGGDGQDSIFGGDGSDTLIGGFGNDSISGEDGDDLLLGDAGNDVIKCGSGNDQADGGLGDDTLFAGDGEDSLFGGDGNDTLYSGLGESIFSGGVGSDSFVFDQSIIAAHVADFEDGSDRLIFSAQIWGEINQADFVNVYATLYDGSAFFDFGERGTLTVNGVSSLPSLYDDITFLWL